MLQIRAFEASGYRSLRRVALETGNLTVLAGQNGAGKSNLYRALQLVQAAASGTLAREIAAEGGMQSAFWAGRRSANQPVRIALAVELASPDKAGVYRYDIEVGLPRSTDAAFALEPQIKDEALSFVLRNRRRPLLKRRGPLLLAWDVDGEEHEIAHGLLASETGLSAVEAAPAFPDVHLVRRTLTDWRFYHELRTDTGSALRAPALGVTTPTLASDGRDLAAVFATLAHIRGDTTDLQAAVEDAFPGAWLDIPRVADVARFGLTSPDFRTDGGAPRVFAASELSDGTLRYLALVGALLAYRLPAFIALNEPESSLHPGLVPPLARLIARAAERTQVWVVTHSDPLARELEALGADHLRVVKTDGATSIVGRDEA